MAGLDDQVTYCPALVVHYKVIDVADRSVAGLNLIAVKVAVNAKSLRASQMRIAATVEVADPGLLETIGSINDFLKEALPYYPNLKQEMVRVVLVHPGEFVLPELGEELGRYTSRKLAERGVEIHPNTKVKGVTPREVELTDGTRISGFTLVWTAGTSPHPLLHQLDLPKERNRLKANAAMGVEGFLACGRSVTALHQKEGMTREAPTHTQVRVHLVAKSSPQLK